MIDPLEVVIRHLLTRPSLTDLVGPRIANKHEYGGVWAPGAPSLVVQVDMGGFPDLYTATSRIRVIATCYGNAIQAMRIWKALEAEARGTGRTPVVTSQGGGLLYYLVLESILGQVYDEQVGMDAMIGFFSARVSEDALAQA